MTSTVLFCAGATGDALSGMTGTMMANGEALAGLGWDVEFDFAPVDSRFTPRVDRQLAYLRVLRTVRALRPAVTVAASADGVLVPLLASDLPLVVESHGLEPMHRRAMRAAAIDHPKFGMGHKYVREPLLRSAIRHASLTVVKTREERGFVQAWSGIPVARTAVIGNGVESAFFTTRAPVHGGRQRLAMVGSWSDRKGSREIPYIFERVVAALPKAELFLLGTGVGERSVLECFSPGVRQAIRVYPRLDRLALVDQLAACDVGLFTSWYEGFGNALIEMMATGMPVVSTTAGVAAAAISPTCGALVEPGDTSQLAEAAIAFLRSPELRLKAGVAAQEVARGYTRATVASQWNIALTKVVADRRLRAGRSPR